jgi:uncharacterized RDD family membrane protein YckC
MHIPTKTWLILLTAAHSLLLAPLVSAQESNAAPPLAVPEEATSTNTGSDDALSAAAADNDTNAIRSVDSSQGLTLETGRHRGTRHQPIVLIGQNAELKAGDSAEAVVVIGGSAKVHGKVRDAVVVICGNLEVDGEVGDSAVAVMGNIRIKEGARIHKDAVAVMGTLSAAPGTSIGGDTVSVGGKLDIADGATVKGDRVSVGMPIAFPNMEWLGKWFNYCLFQLRPLAPQVGWVWVVAGVFFLLYLLIAAVFPRPVQVCVESLTRRPATTFLLGLLTKLLVPVIFIILAFTGIGLIVVPFLGAALFFAAIVGKVAILEWIGLQLGQHFGGAFLKPLIAFLVGTLVVTLLYMVPILGLLTYTILSMWGLGCVVTAAFGSMRREMPEKPAAPPPGAGSAPGVAATASLQTMNAEPVASGFAPAWPPASSAPNASAPGTSPSPTLGAATPPVYPHALTFPKAGFWERMGAGFLDVVFVGILSTLVGGMPLGLVVALAYFAGMWTWKGTTIGGIVLRLQVVRCDGGPITFVIALVRGLASAFSLVVLFLGFLWIAWDVDKQGWHDKIAGTVVVRLPRSMPLICV